MGEYLENSIAYMTNNCRSLQIEENGNLIVFNGRLYVVARCSNPDFRIQICPKIRLTIDKDGRGVPSCVYLGETQGYPHINKDKTLCVSTDFDIMLRLKNSVCISDYIERFLKPFFLSFEYWKKTGKPLFGERSHGAQGIIESIKEYANLQNFSDEDAVLLVGWAANRTKFRRLVTKDKQYRFLSRYQNKLAKLRKMDSFFLSNLYEECKDCLKKRDG